MKNNNVESMQTVEEQKVFFVAMIEDFESLLDGFAHFMGFGRASTEMKIFEVYLFCLREKMPIGTCLPAVSVAIAALIGNAQGMEAALSHAPDDESRSSLLAEIIHNRTEGLLLASEWLSNESKTWAEPITNADAERLLSELYENYYSKVSILEVMALLQLFSR